MRTKSTGKNITSALNAYAVLILTYSFGIIIWTQTDLKNLQIKKGTTLTRHRMHHPISATERMTIPRSEGGRGLIDLEMAHDNIVHGLKSYFNSKADSSPLHRIVVRVDKKYTPIFR